MKNQKYDEMTESELKEFDSLNDNTNFDLGDEEDILFFYVPPTSILFADHPWTKRFAMGWKRVSYGNIYFESREISLDPSNDMLCKSIELSIIGSYLSHKSFFMCLLKYNRYDPMEKTTLSRDEYYSNLLKNVTSEKYFRTGDELKKYVYEQHNLTGDKNENT